MLNEIQKSKYTERAKAEVKKLLNELSINEINDDTVCKLEAELDSKVIYLVNDKEDGKHIDEELLKIYDLLTDIVIDNENDLDFLNELFFK